MQDYEIPTIQLQTKMYDRKPVNDSFRQKFEEFQKSKLNSSNQSF